MSAETIKPQDNSPIGGGGCVVPGNIMEPAVCSTPQIQPYEGGSNIFGDQYVGQFGDTQDYSGGGAMMSLNLAMQQAWSGSSLVKAAMQLTKNSTAAAVKSVVTQVEDTVAWVAAQPGVKATPGANIAVGMQQLDALGQACGKAAIGGAGIYKAASTMFTADLESATAPGVIAGAAATALVVGAMAISNAVGCVEGASPLTADEGAALDDITVSIGHTDGGLSDFYGNALGAIGSNAQKLADHHGAAPLQVSSYTGPTSIGTATYNIAAIISNPAHHVVPLLAH